MNSLFNDQCGLLCHLILKHQQAAHFRAFVRDGLNQGGEKSCVCVFYPERNSVCYEVRCWDEREKRRKKDLWSFLSFSRALRASCPPGPEQEKDRRWNEEGPEEVLFASGVCSCQLYSVSLLCGSTFLLYTFSPVHSPSVSSYFCTIKCCEEPPPPPKKAFPCSVFIPVALILVLLQSPLSTLALSLH